MQDKPESPLPLLALVAGALGYGVYRKRETAVAWMQETAGGVLTHVLATVSEPVLALTLALVPMIAIALRVVLTRRTLTSRLSLTILPTNSFDPSDEALSSFARQLSAVPRVVRGWADRRASGVRIRLASTGEGEMVYQVEAPARAKSALQAAIGAYGELEVRPTVDERAGQASGPGQGAQESAAAGEVLPSLDGDADGEGEVAVAEAYAYAYALREAESAEERDGGDGPDEIGRP